MSVKLPFGLHTSDNRFVDAKSVPNGKLCGCICPACRDSLIAKNQGKQKIAHFAHKADCEAAYETVIHGTAKQIIRDLGFVWLPPSLVSAKKKFTFTGHRLEKRYDRLIPDVTVWTSENHKLAVEVRVTHAVSPEKLLMLRRIKLSCVEYDLSTLPRDITYVALKAEFEDNKLAAHWVFNHKARIEELRLAAMRRQFESERVEHNRKIMALARREAIDRLVLVRKNSYAYDIYHVDPCPKGVRHHRFANVNLDCKHCEFCFRIKRQGGVPVVITCGGHRAKEVKFKKSSDDFDPLFSTGQQGR